LNANLRLINIRLTTNITKTIIIITFTGNLILQNFNIMETINDINEKMFELYSENERARYLAYVLCDENRKPLCSSSAEAAEIIGQLDSESVEYLYSAALLVNNIANKSAKELEKN